jgi:hypothetical protein
VVSRELQSDEGCKKPRLRLDQLKMCEPNGWTAKEVILTDFLIVQDSNTARV